MHFIQTNESFYCIFENQWLLGGKIKQSSIVYPPACKRFFQQVRCFLLPRNIPWHRRIQSCTAYPCWITYPSDSRILRTLKHICWGIRSSHPYISCWTPLWCHGSCLSCWGLSRLYGPESCFQTTVTVDPIKVPVYGRRLSDLSWKWGLDGQFYSPIFWGKC